MRRVDGNTGIATVVLPFAFDGEIELAPADGWRAVSPPGGAGDAGLWRWARDGATATLRTDDATGLRTLVFLGPVPGATIAALPRMQACEAARLIASSAMRETLAGLQAARIIAAAELAAPVLDRLGDPDPVVAAHAAEALAAIAPAALEALGIGWGGALFAVPGWRREKLQILRRLPDAADEPGAAVADALSQALTDDDWEIAATAMLAAARTGVRAPTPALAGMRLPQGRRDGVTEHEGHLLLGLRAAAAERLAGPPNPRVPDAARRAVAGDLGALAAADAAFVAALTVPLATGLPLPPPVDWVVAGDTGYSLQDGTRLCWVPPAPHWTGDGAAGPAPRVTRIRQGYFIEAEPRGEATFAGAMAAAGRMRRSCRRPVALPTPLQREAAARGTDARRFPWGMNGARSAWVDLSPYGVTGLVSGPGEWLDAPVAGGRALAAGGARRPACGQCVAADPDNARSYRFVHPAG